MSKTALLALGCPELPVQTSLALYLAYRLRQQDITPVFAGNKSALTLVRVADPDKYYYDGKLMDLDMTIGALAEKQVDFDLCFVFIHSDSGIAYLASIKALSKAKMVAVVFGRSIEELVAQCREVGCENIIAARAVHNPMPLKKQLDEVSVWLPA
jgi:hypothetical protein